MRRLSLNARLAQDAGSTDEIYVALFLIQHELLDKPVRLSTDNTERLSDEPLTYGTRSTWMTADPEDDPFLFVLASSQLPSDLEDAPAAGNIILENVTNDIAKLLRSFTTPATIHMAVVLAQTPNVVELQYQDLKVMSADINAGEVVLEFSREEVELEYYPADRMTRDRFPGMHR